MAAIYVWKLLIFFADYWKNADKYVSSGEKKMYTSFHCLRDETEKNYLLFLCARMACVCMCEERMLHVSRSWNVL